MMLDVLILRGICLVKAQVSIYMYSKKSFYPHPPFESAFAINNEQTLTKVGFIYGAKFGQGRFPGIAHMKYSIDPLNLELICYV